MRALPPDDGVPVLVACSHGTAVASGRGTVARLALAVAAARPGLVVRQAFVDVQPPSPADRVAELAAAGRRGVVVPLLLSTGFHVRVDIARAVAGGDGWAVAADRLGVRGALAPVVADRLAEAGVTDADAVVLAAAGSSDPTAAVDVAAVVSRLAAGRPGPVVAACVSAATAEIRPVPEVVARLRGAGARRVAVATYLLAPGRFTARLADAGADVVTAPLVTAPSTGRTGGTDPRVVAAVLDRYDAACASWSELAARGRRQPA